MQTQIPYQSAAADRIADLEVALGQARDAQETAEAMLRRAEEKAQAEADRADGAEALARALLVDKVEQAAYDDGIDSDLIGASGLDRIADALADDWAHGTPVAKLRVADRLADWEADR